MVSVAVNPQNPSIVFTSGAAGSSGGNGIYKSTDCGATWTKANTGRNSAAIDSGYQWGMNIDPTNPNVMYVSNGYGGPPSLFKTTNGGTDWDPVFAPNSDVAMAVQDAFTQAASMDPTNPNHLVVTFHNNCTGAYAPMCMAETTDGAATWRLFKGPTSGWEEGAGPLVLGKTTFLYSAIFAGVFYTNDSGATWSKVADSGSGNQIYFSPTGAMFLGSNSGIKTSKDGRTWSTIPNSPNAIALIGDGTNLFASFQNDFSGQPFYSAPEASPATWTNVKTPAIKQGGSVMAYDPDHHILYSSDYSAGLWRVVTK
jgi:hypothetical protein